MQKNKIHPYKFSMWIGIASMSMFFAGLTSAYIVRNSQAKWTDVKAPTLFLFSTVLILLSSVCLHWSIRQFKQREISRYRKFFFSALVLGIAFLVCQVIAFSQLIQNGILLNGNVAGSFIYVIAGTHAAHVLGGVITLIWVYIRYTQKQMVIYSPIGLEVAALYWHFVDFLWLYLVVFYLLMRH